MLYRFLLMLALLFSQQGWAADIKVELFDCQLLNKIPNEVAQLRTRCDAVETVHAKPSGMLTLTAIVTDTEGKPVAGRRAWLEVVSGDKHVNGGLLQWHVSEVEAEFIDSTGVVSFAGLLLPWNLRWWDLRLALVVENDEGEQQRVDFPLRTLPHGDKYAHKLVDKPQYVVISSSPPRPEWVLSYDGIIPSGTVVRWYVHAYGMISKLREFTTRERSHSLRLMGGKGEVPINNCYTLVVAIGAPVSLVTATRGGYGC